MRDIKKIKKILLQNLFNRNQRIFSSPKGTNLKFIIIMDVEEYFVPLKNKKRAIKRNEKQP
jgi:hypothetical protein